MAFTLKALRVNANYTIEEVAKLVGKSKNTIQNYESYKTSPDIDTALKLAEIYGVKLDDIIFLKSKCA